MVSVHHEHRGNREQEGDCIIMMCLAEFPHGRDGKQKGQGYELVHKLKIRGTELHLPLVSGQRVNRKVNVILELGWLRLLTTPGSCWRRVLGTQEQSWVHSVTSCSFCEKD